MVELKNIVNFLCRRTMIFKFLIVILSCSWISGFNLDTKYPKILQGSPGDYFGFTVALHRNRVGTMALVGAPRANSSTLRDQVFQPGVLFTCGLTASLACKEIILDGKGNTQTDRGSDFSYYDKKDNMWLGVSLDIQQNSVQNDIVTCGHLWKNQFYRQHYLTNGVCYVINSDLDQRQVKKLVPLVQKSKQAIIPPGIYYYAFGQVGTSAAFSEDGKSLLLGAPGLYDWSGTVVSYSADPFGSTEIYNKPIIPDPPPHPSPESYIGYSVSSGKFFENNEIFLAVGAPRDGDSYGRVYIFKPLKTTKNELQVHKKKLGTQFGEYFGAAVLGINVNNDAYTDLFVGAPFYSSESGGDEGKVYVFISNGMGLQAFAELHGNFKPNARFGTALANCGDLNQDGFNDVAIGAPYEDGTGAIYIYHGSRLGINVNYVQRIAAATIDPQLSGFGISISRGLDIDGNQYPDILVGAYASSNAVLFRTSPVIQLFSKILFSPKQINTNVTDCIYEGKEISCVNVTVCLWYTGKHVPFTLDFENEIFVEHPSQSNRISSPRGFFLNKNKQPMSAIQQKSNLAAAIDNCILKVLYIRPEIKDVITPIKILYRYNLMPPKTSAQFNSSYPIVDASFPTNITSAITFQNECGRDDKCLSDLVVKAEVVGSKKNVPLIIGKNTTLTLSITVQNNGEPAYLSELMIHLPPEISSINQDFCSSLKDQQSQSSNTSLICDLGNPLPQGKEVKIQIKLDITKIPSDKKRINILLEAQTVSTEEKPSDNIVDLPIYFKTIADISIFGTPSHEQVPYNETATEIPVSVTHTYYVMNHGPSPLDIIDIVLHIPKAFQGKDGLLDFLIFTNLEADSGKQLTIPAKCNDTYIQIKSTTPIAKPSKEIWEDNELVAQDYGNVTNTAMKRDSSGSDVPVDRDEIPGDSKEVQVRSKKSAEKSKVSSKRWKNVVINCETAQCVAIQCSASPFIDTRKFARITVSVQLNISVLNDYIQDPWYRIEFITFGEVKIRNDKGDIQPKTHHPDKITVKTVIVHSGPLPSEELAQWIIFASAGTGILLLLIFIVLLIKFGFFKRKQKEKMEGLMAENYEAESKETDTLR